MSSFTKVAALGMAIFGLVCGQSANAQWGDLKGQILLEGDIPKFNPLDTAGKDPAVCGVQPIVDEKLVVDPKSKGIANFIIYLAKKPAMVHPSLVKSPSPTVDFDQKGCRFLPHALLVRTDQQVVIKSDDDTAHNTHILPVRNDGENFIVTPKNREGVKMKLLSKVEKVPTKVVCDIHPWMLAHWMILDHPYAAVSDENGNFEIKNLPVGTHEFLVWHEQAGWLEKKYAVDIKAGVNQQKPLKYTVAQIMKP